MADKEKVKKKKVKKEEKGEEAPPPAPEPEPEPAPPPSAPTSTKSSRHSSKRKAVKRSGSNVFSLFTTQQVAEFKEGNYRMKKCQELLNWGGFKNLFPNIIYDEDNADLPQKKCTEYQPTVMDPQHSRSLSDINTTVKMFQCPFKSRDGSNQGKYLVFSGILSDTLFMVRDENNLKKFIGHYYSREEND
ncbi:hypothetical protein V9T40_014465 [Parthenolecanium corni]|uniref:Uncharacterized protein n=1 Tax=Parthenolecanium corni TaxID=536013 RepID=A0AAN9XXD8_9HEMI